jgi:hypothetical protein
MCESKKGANMARDAWAKACLTVVLAGHTGCGLNFQERVEEEADRLRATQVGGVVVAAGEAIGFLPVLHCGAAAPLDEASFIPALQQKVGHCASVQTGAPVDNASAFDLTFPASGCKVGKSSWTGQIQLVVGGGDDRNDVTIDLRQLAIDGHPVDGLIKRTSCGDMDTYELHLKSHILLNKGMAPIDVVFDGTGAMKPGLGLIGTDLTVLNGSAGADIDGKGVTLVFTDLQWEPGANLPLKGGLALEQPNGKETAFTFDDDKGEMTISVNGGAPHTVPMP